MYWLDNNTGISTAPTIPAVISATKRYFTNGGAGVQPSTPEDFWFHMIQEELLGVLTMAGVTPVKNDLGQLAKAIQSIAFSAYPVGAPIPWPTSVPPSGFLSMIGQSFSADTYPKLALAYPALALPDMRAEFIRGLDDGRGVDIGRAILSPQSDMFKSHTHRPTGVCVASTNNPGVESHSVSSTYAQFNQKISAPTIAEGGSETRPRNIPFLYIVRAA